MSPNFTTCAAEFLHNETLSKLYGWKGRVYGIESNSSRQISLEGCIKLCGTGNDYYPWTQVAGAITTWVLPIVGIILQAPFESNQFFPTLWALARWIGSPIASLAIILSNVRVTAKCALMVDMSISCSSSSGDESHSEDTPENPTAYTDMRDSFYLLSAMNQYSMKPVVTELKKVAEGLLRFALFSKDLELKTNRHAASKTLQQLRRETAAKLREHRRRGAVPVFISTLWFSVSLVISIQGAFGFLGVNAEAHDLAIGLLMCWLPVLILASIVDRNFTSSAHVRKKLNNWIDSVCESLYDLTEPGNEEQWQKYLQTFEQHPDSDRMAQWVREIADHSREMKGFFVQFAGQGRQRWHYGAAHPILTSIEKSYIAKHRRPWLRDEQEARISLVLHDPNTGLVWRDWRELWQLFSAAAIVCSSTAGAFFLSFVTPTVGLGCRSGSFLLFTAIGILLAICEILVWATSIPTQFQGTVRQRLRRSSTIARDTSKKGLRRVEAAILAAADKLARITGHNKVAVLIARRTERFFEAVHAQTGRQWAEKCFFRPLESANAAWLVYSITAQVVGAFENCECQASSFSRMGGYIDFTQYDVSDIAILKVSWPIATAISSSAMAFSMMFIVREWCVQSHLSTENYRDAQRGLKFTRWYLRLEQFSPYILLKRILNCIWIVFRRPPSTSRGQNTLVWQWQDQPTHQSFPASRRSGSVQSGYPLSDFGSPTTGRRGSQAVRPPSSPVPCVVTTHVEGSGDHPALQSPHWDSVRMSRSRRRSTLDTRSTFLLPHPLATYARPRSADRLMGKSNSGDSSSDVNSMDTVAIDLGSLELDQRSPVRSFEIQRRPVPHRANSDGFQQVTRSASDDSGTVSPLHETMG